MPTSNIYHSLSSGWWTVFILGVYEKLESVQDARFAKKLFVSRTHPSEAALRGHWTQQKDNFRTPVSPTWTLFIALRKALWSSAPYHLSFKAHLNEFLSPSQIIKQTRTHKQNLCKPHYSHLLTRGCRSWCSEVEGAYPLAVIQT